MNLIAKISKWFSGGNLDNTELFEPPIKVGDRVAWYLDPLRHGTVEALVPHPGTKSMYARVRWDEWTEHAKTNRLLASMALPEYPIYELGSVNDEEVVKNRLAS